MPKFEMVQKHEAVERAASSSKRGKIVALYKFFIEQLQEGKAGRLQPSEGETVQAIRRRLNKAASLADKAITVKTVDEEVYFWISESERPSRRHARRLRKTASNALNNVLTG
jgi:hypothetical protein